MLTISEMHPSDIVKVIRLFNPAAGTPPGAGKQARKQALKLAQACFSAGIGW
jgi:hypothetical protein